MENIFAENITCNEEGAFLFAFSNNTVLLINVSINLAKASQGTILYSQN